MLNVKRLFAKMLQLIKTNKDDIATTQSDITTIQGDITDLITETNASPVIVGATLNSSNSAVFTFPAISHFGIFFIESTSTVFRGIYLLYKSTEGGTVALTPVLACTATTFAFTTSTNKITFTSGSSTSAYIYYMSFNRKQTSQQPTTT